jgi:hypothetical protein
VGPNGRWGFNDNLLYKGLDLQVNYRPLNALSISLSPSVGSRINTMQYVNTTAMENDDRYIIAEIDQVTARLSLRMTYVIKPNLSVQYWGQPFGTHGEYSKFKYVEDANASEYNNRFTELPNESVTLSDDIYAVDENKDGKTDYSFDNPDFNVGQYRSNMVVRWEYVPSSTIYIVWSQNMNGSYDTKTAGIVNDFNFNEKAHNIFLMKLTHRFAL